MTKYYCGLFVCLFCAGEDSGSVGQSGLRLMVLLPVPSECWDYMHAPPHMLYFIIVIFYKIKGKIQSFSCLLFCNTK